MFRLWLTFSLIAIVCSEYTVFAEQATADSTADIHKPTPAQRAAILGNMSTNSDKRCLGISAVAEALLDGKQYEGSEAPEKIAVRIYRNLATGQQLLYPRNVEIDGTRFSIDSKNAIEKLSNSVAQQYKRDFLRLDQTAEGRQKLLAAQDSFLATKDDLNRILDADPDKTEVFCGSGTRVFSDKTVKESHHAFLISKLSNGNFVVHDANDPGSPIHCEIKNSAEGVTIQWTCRYQNIGQMTTQNYLIVPKDDYFLILLGR